MKKIYVIFMITLILMFGLGFLVARHLYHQPTKELCVGTPITHSPGSFEFNKKFCLNNLDPEDEWNIDGFEVVFARRSPIEITDAPSEFPDFMIQLASLKFGAASIMTQVWMTESGAIIGNWDYQSNTITDATQLSKDDTDYLLLMIGRIEK